MTLRTFIKKISPKTQSRASTSADWFKGFAVLLLTLSMLSAGVFGYNFVSNNLNQRLVSQADTPGGDVIDIPVTPPSDPTPVNPPNEPPPVVVNPPGDVIDIPVTPPPDYVKPEPRPPTEPPAPTFAKLKIEKSCVLEATTTPCNSLNVIKNTNVRYTVTVTNFGDKTATGVDIVDDYDQSKISVLRVTSGAVDTGDYLSFSLGSINAFTAKSVQYVSNVKVWGPGSVVNTAKDFADNDTTTGDDTATYTFPLESQTNVSLTKSCTFDGRPCNASPVPTGSTVEYSLTAKNDGPGKALFTDIVDNYDQSKVSILSTSSGVVDTGDYISFAVGTMTVGQITTITYKAKVNVPGPAKVPNIATVFADNDTNTADNTANYTFDIAAPTVLTSDVSITKSCLVDGRACNAAPVENNKRVEYTLVVTATGNTPAKNVKVVDDYDQNLLKDLGNIDNSGSSDSNVINWSLGEIANGASKTLKYQATVNTAESKTIKNIAIVIADNDSNATNNRAEYSFNTPVAQAPAISIEKVCKVGAAANSAICDKVAPGSTVYYTLLVKNIGNVALSNAYAEDNFDANQLTLISGSANIGVLESKAGFSKFGQFNLGLSEVKTITYAAKVASGLTNGTVVENKAVAKSDQINSNEVKARFTVVVNIIVDPGTPVIKIEHLCYIGLKQPATDGSSFGTNYKPDCGDAKPGDTVWYAVVVNNTGTATAKDVTVALPVVNPPYIEGQTFVNPDTGILTPYSFVIPQLESKNGIQKIYRSTVKKDVPLLANLDVNSTATVVYSNPGLGNNTSDTAVFHIKQIVPEKAIALEKLCVVVATSIPCNAANSGLKAGSIVTYTLRVTNSGKSDLAVNTLVDTYDSKISAVTDMVPTGVWNGATNTVTWSNLGVFKAGGVKEFRFNAKLGDKVIVGNIIKNTAKVTAQDGLSATANYDFTILGSTVIVTPPGVIRTGAADVMLLVIFTLSLAAGVYFYSNSGKLSTGFGGSKGKF